MEVLKSLVSKVKCEFSKYIEDKYLKLNYGIKTNKNNDSFNKLELIFLSNIDYLDLKENHIKRIKTRDYTNLFKSDAYIKPSEEVSLEETVVINKTTIINTPIESDWEETEF